MGGQAFASGPDPLLTPRMSPSTYRAVRQHCEERLRQHFVIVAVPIEGPGKESYGDIDIFVAWDRRHVFPHSTVTTTTNTNTNTSTTETETETETGTQIVRRALGAIRYIQQQEDSVIMAIPWWDTPKYIQVDVSIYSSLGQLQWMLFTHGHGDLVNVLGPVIRPFGLTADGTGLHIRIPEIETQNKKEARVLLTDDPVHYLRFLGLRLDQTHWEQPFDSQDDLLECAATCRLFVIESGGEEDEDKKNLKSNDRSRMRNRALSQRWFEEFIPACRAAGRFIGTPPTRDHIRQQAFEYFPSVQPIYTFRLKQWRIKRQRETLWKEVIKTTIPTELENSRRSCCASALKKIIMADDPSFDGIEAPASLRDDDGLFDEEAVRIWVTENWQMVLTVAWRIQTERLVAKAKTKHESERTASGEEKGAPPESVAQIGEAANT
ncbi:hypothetical protein GGS20DRAFT_359350 [Poronia punctata]|nr:hypothetical protein GGS20DRAFT_359350 [Poronia punctata]